MQVKKVRFRENTSDITTTLEEDNDEVEEDNNKSRYINARANRRQQSKKESSSGGCESISPEPPQHREPLPFTLERVNQTYNKLKVKLKEVQEQLKQNPREGRLKLTLFIIALYSRSMELMKPFPKFLMKGSKPDIARTKVLMNNMPDLNLIQSYSRYEFYTNYLAIQFLHWLTVEMTSPALVQVSHEVVVQIFQKINPVTKIIKPDIIMKLNVGNSRTNYNKKKLVYIVADTNQIHRLIHYGPESLLDKHQGTVCATNNALANLTMIEQPEQTQVECSDIDYVTLLIAELKQDRSTEAFHGKLGVQDMTYLVSNPKLLKMKYLLLYKLGTYDAYKKLLQHERRRLVKEMRGLEEEDERLALWLYAGFVFISLLLVTLFPT